jgi:ATP-binding cassette subfamily C (CFTR/MRP) protein 1
MNSTVELQDGKIEIDGLDISKIELNVLRNRLALVPQDAVLFLGTLRDNLYDPFFIFLFKPHPC